MDIAYLVFVMMIPFISPGAYGYDTDSADAGNNSTDFDYSDPYFNETSFNSTSFNMTPAPPAESDSSGGLSAIGESSNKRGKRSSFALFCCC